ncbi:flagellar assembly peptidoglycan hydrolase FlgJ [Oleiagrimonas sp. C23AA]|uniref:flagellar assembly peptidoglycan hydrolase FlgJ n=1 Tax=Oleiagrimonas sp. C23AA TaxID=2719047 RepID=UPI0014230079|nr:flagellar assembly peptidoglycan hydrolase FlgJ [Oleiagrimonas sp. C23AA]NII09206.1 flagellar assembly peptidoglycan hydrolase FlgJ [Oleiagrimonas sp. C23AA]
MDALNANLPQSLDTWTDLSGFKQLRASAERDGKSALPEVAKQFEAIFTQMMLKSMRAASFGNPMFDSQAGKAYQDLFDQQLSLSLSGQGKGIGIADMLIKQLGGKHTPGSGKDATPQTLALDGAAQLAAAGSESASKAASSDDDGDALSATVRALGTVLNAVAPAASSAVKAAASWTPGNPIEFVKAVAPHAEAAARKLGVSVRAVLAQAALETGWGKHMPTQSNGENSYNLFGIKAGSSWDGQRANVPTLEYENGVAVRKRESFRAYDSPTDSFNDYANLVANNPRYAQALNRGGDVAGFAHALVAGGYATDPHYASKLTAIANSDTMREALASLKNAANVPSKDVP